MDALLIWDIKLFLAINKGMSNPFFDLICPLLRDKYLWVPFYTFLISFFLINFKRKGFVIILFAIFAVALSDQLTASIIKPLVHRIRPCNDYMLIEQINILVNCGSGFSFPSAHAANHFGLSFYLIALFGAKRKWIIPAFIIWAAAISFSQIYVGVHYPLDIVGGILIGITTGFSMALLAVRSVD